MMRSFQDFVNRHNRNYLTKEEFNARYNVFKANLAIINDHNQHNATEDGF
jgi:hypothetical protein